MFIKVLHLSKSFSFIYYIISLARDGVLFGAGRYDYSGWMETLINNCRPAVIKLLKIFDYKLVVI